MKSVLQVSGRILTIPRLFCAVVLLWSPPPASIINVSSRAMLQCVALSFPQKHTSRPVISVLRTFLYPSLRNRSRRPCEVQSPLGRTPNACRHSITKPEQSKPSEPLPPHMYGFPISEMAYSRRQTLFITTPLRVHRLPRLRKPIIFIVRKILPLFRLQM